VRTFGANALPTLLAKVYRCAFYGRPGTGFVDLPADIINDPLASEDLKDIRKTFRLADSSKSGCDETSLDRVVELLKNAKSPLVLIGKGVHQSDTNTIPTFADGQRSRCRLSSC
jgi:2-hydroxyacyl-CoA lyase 1